METQNVAINTSQVVLGSLVFSDTNGVEKTLAEAKTYGAVTVVWTDVAALEAIGAVVIDANDDLMFTPADAGDGQVTATVTFTGSDAVVKTFVLTIHFTVSANNTFTPTKVEVEFLVTPIS